MRSPLLSINEISKIYNSNETDRKIALDKVSMQFAKNEITCVLGPNGAGKTTLFNIISRLINNDTGTICLDTREISDFSPIDWKKQVLYLPDEFSMYEFLTGFEYLTLVARLLEIDAARFQKRMDALNDFFEVKSFYNQEIYRYSHGMKKRLMLVSLLLREATILLLDEPFNGLDPETIFNLKKYLNGIKPEKIIIYSTHTLDIVNNFADRVYILFEGRMKREIDRMENRENMEDLFMAEIGKYKDE
jgi:ABC-2 type transport system ATP-binding protein